MKKLTIIFSCLSISMFSMNAQAQVKIRTDSNPSTAVKEDPNQKNLQVVQPAQSSQQVKMAQYQSTGVSNKYYSIDPAAFSSSWGVYEIRKVESGGAYLYSSTTSGTPPYLIAPVNLPHNAAITNMTAVFYDVSATQDLRAILWQGGPNFGGPDSYNLGQIQSNGNTGLATLDKPVNAKVDNQNHSYYVAIAPANAAQWPENGDLKIKRVTITYTEAEN